MNVSRRSVFQYQTVAGLLVLGFPLVVPIGVLHAVKEDVPGWAALLIASSSCVPIAIAAFLLLRLVDLARGIREPTGITLAGALFVQALVFVYAPLVAGEMIPDLGIGGMLCSWVTAAACAWAGYQAKGRRKNKLALAKLAETHPTIACRFLVRTDTKGWESIQPDNVLAYQQCFQQALAAMGDETGVQPWRLTAQQQEALVRSAEKASLASLGCPERLWPGVITDLVLTYLGAPPSERDRDHAEWAAAVATRTNASDLREGVRPLSSELFARHSKLYK